MTRAGTSGLERPAEAETTTDDEAFGHEVFEAGSRDDSVQERLTAAGALRAVLALVLVALVATPAAVLVGRWAAARSPEVEHPGWDATWSAAFGLVGGLVGGLALVALLAGLALVRWSRRR